LKQPSRRLKTKLNKLHDAKGELIGFRLWFSLLVKGTPFGPGWQEMANGEIDTRITKRERAEEFMRAVRHYYDSQGKLPPLFKWAARYA
jgi:hypothetical protein